MKKTKLKFAAAVAALAMTFAFVTSCGNASDVVDEIVNGGGDDSGTTDTGAKDEAEEEEKEEAESEEDSTPSVKTEEKQGGTCAADWNGEHVTVAFPEGFSAGTEQEIKVYISKGADADYLCILAVDPDNKWAKWQATNGLKYYLPDGSEIELGDDDMLGYDQLKSSETTTGWVDYFVIKPTADQIKDFKDSILLQGYNVVVSKLIFTWTESK